MLRFADIGKINDYAGKAKVSSQEVLLREIRRKFWPNYASRWE